VLGIFAGAAKQTGLFADVSAINTRCLQPTLAPAQASTPFISAMQCSADYKYRTVGEFHFSISKSLFQTPLFIAASPPRWLSFTTSANSLLGALPTQARSSQGLVAHKTHHQPLGVEAVIIQWLLLPLLFSRAIVLTYCFQSPHNLICNAYNISNGSAILDFSGHLALLPT
jgi:hypothetical protein